MLPSRNLPRVYLQSQSTRHTASRCRPRRSLALGKQCAGKRWRRNPDPRHCARSWQTSSVVVCWLSARLRAQPHVLHRLRRWHTVRSSIPPNRVCYANGCLLLLAHNSPKVHRRAGSIAIVPVWCVSLSLKDSVHTTINGSGRWASLGSSCRLNYNSTQVSATSCVTAGGSLTVVPLPTPVRSIWCRKTPDLFRANGSKRSLAICSFSIRATSNT